MSSLICCPCLPLLPRNSEAKFSPIVLSSLSLPAQMTDNSAALTGEMAGQTQDPP